MVLVLLCCSAVTFEPRTRLLSLPARAVSEPSFACRADDSSINSLLLHPSLCLATASSRDRRSVFSVAQAYRDMQPHTMGSVYFSRLAFSSSSALFQANVVDVAAAAASDAARTSATVGSACC